MPIWLGRIVFSIKNQYNNLFAHLVPRGTPVALMPVIVIIETVRNVIRPGTLSIRLAANIVAGHLLLTLLGRPEGNKEMAKFVLSHLDEGLDQEGKRQFTCRLCEFSSERKEKVRQHVESWHGDQLGIRYRCDFCEKAYKCHSNLRSHVSATHKHVWSQN